ncbi:TolC family protein [Dinghuibacter silviterrae]|uniref:Outer membrane protein TolC n=1 Tax=Dinghuibacter silviterrae TaxID=1539049 RepID=A0A4R8DVX6_9BACT|nr:TolC family protein [Dinghuibacter silviterrae]TDX02216.1 outer membrane protein TolC [Dinghuibacter silviterrae]
MDQIVRLGLACLLLGGAAQVGLPQRSFAQTAPAAAPAPTGPLNLKSCLQFALAHNQQIAVTRFDEKTGLEKIKETRSQALPQVNGTGSLQDNVQKQVLVLPPALAAQFGSGGKPIPITLTWQMSAGATLDQKIYDQSVFTAVKAAKAGMDYYKMHTALTQTQVIEQVAQVYYRAQVTGTQVAVLDSNIANITKVMNSTQNQFENGLARKIDVDRLKVNLTNLNTQRTALVDSIIEQGFQLRYLMGMSLDEPLSLEMFAPKTVEDEIGQHLSLDSGLNLNNRLEYTILKKQAELEEYQKKAYKAQYYPSLAFQGNYSTNGVSDNFDFVGHGTTAIWYQVGYIALNLKVPIFDGGGRRARVNQAQIAIDQYNEQAAQTASQLDMDYRNSKIFLATSIDQIKAQKANLDLALEVYNVTQSNYGQGLSNLTDLLDAENSYLQAENNYNSALLQYKLAEIGLIKANGNLQSLLN